MTVDLARLGSLANTARDKARSTTRAGDRSWYRVSNQGDRSELWIYDVIGEWGVSAQDFVGDLKTLGVGPLDLHINSEGGQVFDGIAIYTALKQHPAQVTAYVDGIAASAASFIAMAADTVVVAKNARLMIHDAAGVVMGNANDMREMADLLDDLSENIASIYDDRAGGGVKKWRKAMAAETWYDAETAVREGLADAVDKPPVESPSNNLRSGKETASGWDSQLFANLVKGVFQ